MHRPYCFNIHMMDPLPQPSFYWENSKDLDTVAWAEERIEFSSYCQH
uniref:Uncharacterized protein n=1 Tax=Anguilla anguilla TaxID=7936 RepID=A0A0E9R3Z6_ANGAN